MINFNQKAVIHDVNSQSWYNEMLSMITEDVISPLIGINIKNDGHPVRGRIPLFLICYNTYGITEWASGDDVLFSYSIAYAFGAYLLRNYGGAELLKEILANKTVDDTSIEQAVKTVTGQSVSFAILVRRFGEAMIYSGSRLTPDVMSFDKTVTKTIGSYTYPAAAFDIWSNIYDKSGNIVKPSVYPLTQRAMKPNEITVHQADEWKDIGDDFSVTLGKPANIFVEFYFMVKPGEL